MNNFNFKSILLALFLLLGVNVQSWATTVYCLTTSNETVKVYYWGGSGGPTWDGSPAMTTDGSVYIDGTEYKLYKYDIGDNKNYIIRQGSEQSGDQNSSKPYYNYNTRTAGATLEEFFSKVYLAGDFTKWGDNKEPFTTIDGNIYTLSHTFSANETKLFKLVLGSNTWYGNSGTISADISDWEFTTSGGNCTLKTGSAGEYQFSFNYSTKKLSVTFPAVATTYTLSYSVPDKTSGEVPSSVSDLAGGASVTLATSTGFARTGYTFSKWNDGSADYDAGASYIMPAKNVTMTATWTAKQTTVTLNKNGGTGGSEITYINYGATGKPDGLTMPTRVGYTLEGYFTEQNGGTKVINADGTINGSWAFEDASITLYAHWTEGYMYIVGRFRVKNSVGQWVNTSLNSDTRGWDISSPYIPFSYNESAKTYELNTHATPAELAANIQNNYPWFLLRSGSSTHANGDFFYNSGEAYYFESGKAQVTLSQSVSDPGNANHTKIRFAQTGALTVGEVILSYDPETQILSYIVDGARYTLTYNGNGNTGGNVPAAPQTYDENTIVTVLANTGNLEKTSYAFVGWNTQADGSGDSFIADGTASITMTNNITLYAQWKSLSVVNGITLKDEAGTAGTSFLVGEKITAFPQLSKKGTGTKAYCWEVTDNDGNHVTTGFTSKNGNVTFSLNEAGTYNLTLTISDDDCNGYVNSTYTQTITIGQHQYFMIGGAFWATGDKEDLDWNTNYTSNSIDLRFRPTMNKGEYCFGPMKFTNNDSYHNYQTFRIYDKAKNTEYVAQSDGDFYVKEEHTQEHPITLKATTDIYFHAYGLEDENYFLFIQDGKMWVSAKEPERTAKVRLEIAAANGHTYYTNEIVLPATGEESDTLSFYTDAAGGTTYTMQMQEVGEGWSTSKISMTTAPVVTERGVYTVTLTQTTTGENTTVTFSTPEKYTGSYYVRAASAIAAGGWDNYLEEEGSKMRYTDKARNDAFNYFHCVYCGNGSQDLRFCVANDYNPNLSYTMTTDEICTEGKLLGQGANIRFMWDSRTGAIGRAYLAGSADAYYLRIMPDPDHNRTYSNEGGTTLLGNVKLKDIQDWVYSYDAYARLGAKIALQARYKGRNQYFYGNGELNNDTPSTYEFLIGTAPTSETVYKMRMTYDFKVDRLVCGWLPTHDIDENLDLNADALIIREHNEDALLMHVTKAGGIPHSIIEVKTVYGVMQLNKSVMTDHPNNSSYPSELLMYWIAFPFDVNVRDIFGISGFNQKWRILKYNGKKRAEIGWFRETSTFWEPLTADDVMNANEGYVLSLNRNYFAPTNAEVWSHGIQSVSLYFPSAQQVGTISLAPRNIEIPEYKCEIDRYFEQDMNDTEKDPSEWRNHKTTDSNWHVIGVPFFERQVGNAQLSSKYYYEWSCSDSEQAYNVVDATAYEFKPTFAYMIQWSGMLNWAEGTTPVDPSPYKVARRAPAADDPYYKIGLELQSVSDDKLIDRTYVELREGAANEFVLNEDLYKQDNSGSNLYGLTVDGYHTGANVLPMANASVVLGLDIQTASSYRFSMPKDVDCDVYLEDTWTGSKTQLNYNDYEIDLEAQDYTGRFVLSAALAPVIPTEIEQAGEGEIVPKQYTRKVIVNGQLYMLRDGQVFDAIGHRVK